MSGLRNALRIIIYIVITLVLIIVGMLIYVTLADYRPKPMVELSLRGKAAEKADRGKDISCIIWNIGYAGLGQEMDFFYDGGKKVRPSLQQYQDYLSGVYNFISHSDTIDFILIQEVDRYSKRSFYIDQADLLANTLTDYQSAFAKNYDVDFIPLPLFNPMSKVTAGLMSFSRFKISECLRISSPANFSWPKSIFFLDRCFLLMRCPLSTGKELVMINLHLSAWEEGTALRYKEMELLEELALKEYQIGNYVVAAGDWNQPPAGFAAQPFLSGDLGKKNKQEDRKSTLNSAWRMVYDASVPSNRDLDKKYIKGKTRTSVIDYYLLSPNIEAKEVRTLYNGFAFSDHHPVYLRIGLLPDSLMTTNPTLPVQ